MTVEDLYYFLEEGLNNGEFDLETEVRFAMQPNSPIELQIGADATNVEGTIYLHEEKQLGYIDEEVAQKINWA